MQETELLNHLLNIEDITLNLRNDCRNTEFVRYISNVKRAVTFNIVPTINQKTTKMC